uniref:AAA+ ATPase domain-containing protein n=1 Tax=Glossina austeni TaxID=7395 RepID=A0A1A9VIS2_GLOAU
MNPKFHYILLTGPPGIGKTTLVRKICEDLLNTHKIACDGFFTEEVRDARGERVGFDVVTLQGKRGILARSKPSDNLKRPRIGKYSVYIQEFEDFALPVLSSDNQSRQLLVIDEIGKMELISKKFEAAVNFCIEKCIILATIPPKMHHSLLLVQKLEANPKTRLFVVSKDNRNKLQVEIVKTVLNALKN